jgi:Gamma-glutamyl cyclotransferase, AIG2-like
VLFIFGTLLDPVTRGRVLGRPLRETDAIPALLAGCERVYARGHEYPVLVRAPEGIVDGLLIPRLTAREKARLRIYEGSGYRLARVRVRALTEMAVRKQLPAGRPLTWHPLVWAKVFAASGLGATARPWLPLGHHARRVR